MHLAGIAQDQTLSFQCADGQRGRPHGDAGRLRELPLRGFSGLLAHQKSEQHAQTGRSEGGGDLRLALPEVIRVLRAPLDLQPVARQVEEGVARGIDVEDPLLTQLGSQASGDPRSCDDPRAGRLLPGGGDSVTTQQHLHRARARCRRNPHRPLIGSFPLDRGIEPVIFEDRAQHAPELIFGHRVHFSHVFKLYEHGGKSNTCTVPRTRGTPRARALCAGPGRSRHSGCGPLPDQAWAAPAAGPASPPPRSVLGGRAEPDSCSGSTWESVISAPSSP